MIFRQLFEPISSTYTYLLACEETRAAVLVDPVLPTWERDLSVLNGLGLKLALTLETHLHADHITSAVRLKRETGCRTAGPAKDALPCTDLPVDEQTRLKFGSVELFPVATPGHTDSHFAYRMADRVLTGDALLIDGCGRTDFQGGSAQALYQSIVQRLFVLPDDCLVFPAHDYQGRHVSTIAQEKQRNPRLAGRSEQEFVELMRGLKLPYPKFLDYALPGNRQCGVCPEVLPDHLQEYCDRMRQSPQG